MGLYEDLLAEAKRKVATPTTFSDPYVQGNVAETTRQDNANIAVKPTPRGIGEDIATHYAIGANKYVALPAAGLTQMAGDALGIKPIADIGKGIAENANSWIARKEQESPSQRFQDISSIGDAAKWAGEQVAEFVPQLVVGAVTGGAGAAAGRAVASGANVMQAATRGAQAATALGSIGMEASTIYQGQEEGKKDLGKAAIYGTAAGLLDSAIPNYLMQKTGIVKLLPGMSKVAATETAPVARTFKEGVKDVAKTAGGAIPAEAAQEGVQTVLERIGSDQSVQSEAAKKDGFWKVASEQGIRAAINPDAWNDIVESMAAGGLIGGVMGGGMSAATNVADALQTPKETAAPIDGTTAQEAATVAPTEPVTVRPAQPAPTATISTDPEMAASGAGIVPAQGIADQAAPVAADSAPKGVIERAVSSINPYQAFAETPFSAAPQTQPETGELPTAGVNVAGILDGIAGPALTPAPDAVTAASTMQREIPEGVNLEPHTSNLEPDFHFEPQGAAGKWKSLKEMKAELGGMKQSEVNRLAGEYAAASNFDISGWNMADKARFVKDYQSWQKSQATPSTSRSTAAVQPIGGIVAAARQGRTTTMAANDGLKGAANEVSKLPEVGSQGQKGLSNVRNTAKETVDRITSGDTRYQFPDEFTPSDVNTLWDDLYSKHDEIAQRNQPKIETLVQERERLKSDRSPEAVKRKKAISDEIDQLHTESQIVQVYAESAFERAQSALATKAVSVLKDKGINVDESDVFDEIAVLSDGRINEVGWKKPLLEQVVESFSRKKDNFDTAESTTSQIESSNKAFAEGGDVNGRQEGGRQEVLTTGEPSPAPASPATFGDTNKVFTRDRADKARALLRSKLNQLNSGLDPEMVMAGISLSGYYVEAGFRTFAEYSAKMIDDLGEAVKPYLKSWYMAVRHYPGFDNAGMETEEAVLRSEPAKPAERRKNTEKRRQLEAMTQEELRRELFTDPMTGLGNKRAFLEVAKRPHQAYIDADDLKYVNDTYGHQTGDALLVAVGEAIAKETKQGYHLSGDEFALHADTVETLQSMLDRIVKTLSTVELKADGQVVKTGIGISYGIGATTEEADKAMQQHKKDRTERGERGNRGEKAPEKATPAEPAFDHAAETKTRNELQARWDAANDRATALGTPAALAVQDKFENGDLPVEEFERILDAETPQIPTAKFAAVRKRHIEKKLAAATSAKEKARLGKLLETLQGKQKPTEPVAAAQQETKPAAGKIEDFGEKIGGARKDTAERGFSKTRRAKDGEDNAPAWRRQFVVADSISTPGRFAIIDKKKGLSFSSGRSQTFASEAEAEAAIPLYAVAMNHHVYQNSDGGWSIYKKTGPRKRLKVVEKSFPSREEAMRYMAENAVKLLETKTNFGEEILPIPEIAIRKGTERRSGPATPEMFMETFAPRGIEFGNWNNQEERQQVMNHAYDGLLDLAEVLNVPPKALMLDGDLAIAFGARGQGLTGAKAHYERNYSVINLTKMNGAGSLAHEWFHALDHYLGRLDGKASSAKETNARGDQVFKTRSTGDMLSDGISYKSKLRPELQEAYKRLIQTMYKKAEQYVEDTQQTEKFVGAARENLRSSLDQIRKNLTRDLATDYTWRRSKRGLAPASAEQLAEFDRLANILVEGGDLETKWKADNPNAAAQSRLYLAGRNTNDTLEGISTIMKAVRNRNGFNSERTGTLDKLRSDMAVFAARLKMLQDAQSQTEKTKQVPTSFAMEAKKMDQARSGDYWSEPHEMAARAFAAYVEDKVAEQGGQSDFLVYHAHGGILVPMIDGFVARPYPEGKERVAVNKAFDDFLSILQTKETDKGVALFAKDNKPATSGIPAADIDKSLAPILKNWKNAPNVTVVQSVEKLPARALMEIFINQYDPKSIQAVFVDGAVHLVADNLSSVEEAQRKLLHEVKAHFGLRAVMGNPSTFEKTMLQADLYYRAKKGDVYRKIAKTYGYDLKNRADRIKAAEEMIAHEAETGGASTFLSRVVAAVKDFLRQIGITVQMGEAEIRELLASAERFLAGENSDGRMADATRFANDAEQQAHFALKQAIDAVPWQEVTDYARSNWQSILNPLDWSRTAKFFDDWTPTAIKAGIGYVAANPHFEAERDAAKRPFVEEGAEREINRMKLLLAFFGYEPGEGDTRTVRQQFVDFFTKWHSGQESTEWEGLNQRYAKLDKQQNAAINTLAVQGDVNNTYYSSYRNAMMNKQVKASGLTEETFNLYRDVYGHMQRVSKLREQWTEHMMLEAGIPKAVVDKHISDYRNTVRQVHGWLSRNHGNGEYAVSVHHVVRDLPFTVREVTGEGQQAFLPFYPGVRAMKEIEKLAGEATVTLTGKGAVVVTAKKGENLDEFMARTKEIIPQIGPQKVKVYARYHTMSGMAKRHENQVRANLKEFIPENYREGEEYKVSSDRVDVLTEEIYQNMKSDMAMEAGLQKAFDKAFKTGDIDREELDSLKDNLVLDTAEMLLGRAAGKYQIRRAPNLIEGYDTDNLMANYQDYMTSVAGLLSKADYARRQFAHMKKASIGVKPWAYKYVFDSLRNMGLGDRISGNLRAFVSLWYMGLKPATALINATQIYTIGVADLGRVMPKGQSAIKAIARAQRDTFAGKLTKDEKMVFDSAIIRQQEAASAMAQITGHNEGSTGKAGKLLHNITGKTMALFQNVEIMNRKTMILAAYRVLRSSGLKEGEVDEKALKQALDINNSVNFDQGRHNLPGWARTPVGHTLYALQSFTWNNFNWIYNRATSGEKRDMIAMLRYTGMLMLIGGAGALAGGDELDKLYRKLRGKSLMLEAKMWTHQHAKEYGTLGEIANAFAWNGLGGVAGVNISNSMRLQMPVVSQMIGDATMPEAFAGVYAGLFKKAWLATEAASHGDMYRAMESAAPEAIAGPMRAYRQYDKGMTTLKGKPVFDEHGKPLKYSKTDAALRMAGFQPAEQSQRMAVAQTAKELQTYWKDRRDNLLTRMRTTPAGERADVTRDIIRFNKELRESQALGLVRIIKPKTITQALTAKPDKRKLKFSAEAMGD